MPRPSKIHRIRVACADTKNLRGYDAVVRHGTISLNKHNLHGGTQWFICMDYLYDLWVMPGAHLDFDICVQKTEPDQAQAVEFEYIQYSYPHATGSLRFQVYKDSGKFETETAYVYDTIHPWLQTRGFKLGDRFWVWIEY